MFRVGQKVVCVDSEMLIGIWAPDEVGPIVGGIYTIRRIFLDYDGDAIVWLNEIARGPLAKAQHGDNAGYLAIRFRPVVERKTDISIFTRMLTDDFVGAPV